MNTTQVLDNILAGLASGTRDIRSELSAWISTSGRFAAFCDENRDKIRKKFMNASTEEDGRDVHAELEIAKRIVGNSQFVPTYEPFGSTVKGPDFRVASHPSDFYVEVKRIRKTLSVCAIHEFKSRIREAIKATNSPFGVWVDLYDDDGESIAVDGLLPAVDAVIEEIHLSLNDCRSKLVCGSTASFRTTAVPDVKITIDHLRDNEPDSPTAWFDGSSVVPFSQRESFKFSDLLFRALEQCKPDLPNVLVVRCTSTTHDALDFFQALHEIGKRVVENDAEFFEKKKLSGISDFGDRFKMLSAVLVLCDWPDPIHEGTASWKNPVASKVLDEQSFRSLESTFQ